MKYEMGLLGVRKCQPIVCGFSAKILTNPHSTLCSASFKVATTRLCNLQRQIFSIQSQDFTETTINDVLNF